MDVLFFVSCRCTYVNNFLRTICSPNCFEHCTSRTAILRRYFYKLRFYTTPRRRMNEKVFFYVKPVTTFHTMLHACQKLSTRKSLQQALRTSTSCKAYYNVVQLSQAYLIQPFFYCHKLKWKTWNNYCIRQLAHLFELIKMLYTWRKLVDTAFVLKTCHKLKWIVVCILSCA